MNKYIIWYFLFGVASIYGVNAAKATDKANVKIIACKDAQTVSTSDKAVLAQNSFTKCAEPFGILVAGSKGMTNYTVLQTAKIMAELLDQNRDGVADDPKVVAKLKCTIWMTVHSAQISFSLTGRSSYFEVDKFWHSNGKAVVNGTAARNRIRVEEVHHAITQIGYGLAYPTVFGTKSWNDNSTLVMECKKAQCDWWTHPENKCLTKLPKLPDNMNCMKTMISHPGELYPRNGGTKCSVSKNKETCKHPNCDCIEWYHQVNLIYAGQQPAWINTFRREAGLTGDKVMPKTKAAMINLLKKKNKPMLALLKNTTYNQLQKPMTLDYPVLSGTAPKLTSCATNGGGSNGGGSNGGGSNGGGSNGGGSNGGGSNGGGNNGSSGDACRDAMDRCMENAMAGGGNNGSAFNACFKAFDTCMG